MSANRKMHFMLVKHLNVQFKHYNVSSYDHDVYKRMMIGDCGRSRKTRKKCDENEGKLCAAASLRLDVEVYRAKQ